MSDATTDFKTEASKSPPKERSGPSLTSLGIDSVPSQFVQTPPVEWCTVCGKEFETARGLSKHKASKACKADPVKVAAVKALISYWESAHERSANFSAVPEESKDSKTSAEKDRRAALKLVDPTILKALEAKAAAAESALAAALANPKTPRKASRKAKKTADSSKKKTNIQLSDDDVVDVDEVGDGKGREIKTNIDEDEPSSSSDTMLSIYTNLKGTSEKEKDGDETGKGEKTVAVKKGKKSTEKVTQNLLIERTRAMLKKQRKKINKSLKSLPVHTVNKKTKSSTASISSISSPSLSPSESSSSDSETDDPSSSHRKHPPPSSSFHPLYTRLKREAADDGLKRHFMDWVAGSDNHRDVKELTVLAALGKAFEEGDARTVSRLLAARAYFIYYKVQKDARASFYEALAEGRRERDVVDDPWDRLATRMAKTKEKTAELSSKYNKRVKEEAKRKQWWKKKSKAKGSDDEDHDEDRDERDVSGPAGGKPGGQKK